MQASLGNYTHDKCLEFLNFYIFKPDPVAQSIECLIADPGVMGSIPAQPHTFIEIDHEIFSTVILLLRLIQKGLLSVTIESMCTEYCLTAYSKIAQEKCCLVN